MGEVDRSRLGSEAEEQCVAWLEAPGYRICERNWRAARASWTSWRSGTSSSASSRCGCGLQRGLGRPVADGVPGEAAPGGAGGAPLPVQTAPGPRRMIRFDVMTVLGRGSRAVVEHLPGAFDAGM